MSTQQQVCCAFKLLAKRTFVDLTDAMLLGKRFKQSGRSKTIIPHAVGLSEESITDYILLDLKRSLCNTLYIEKYGKRTESKLGADWYLAFLSTGCGGKPSGIGFRIQSKKADHTSLYKELTGKKWGTQMANLIQQAAATNSVPLYCFYNWWDQKVFNPQWPCACYQTPDYAQWGCSIAHACKVLTAMSNGRPDFKNLSSVSTPWMCLVCCTCAQNQHKDKSQDGSSSDLIRNAQKWITENCSYPDGSVPLMTDEQIDWLLKQFEEPKEVNSKVGNMVSLFGRVNRLLVVCEEEKNVEHTSGHNMIHNELR